jgi:putative transcriptional regulator
MIVASADTIPAVSRIVWKLRETLARRRVTNKALADEIGIHATNVSRLKTRDTLPAIGSDDVEKIRLAITKLSAQDFGVCTLSELIELREE